MVDHPNLSLLGNFDFDAFSKLGVLSAVVWAFSLFLSDFFDTMGTLVGVGKQAGYLTEEGELPEIRKPLLIDSLAAIAGGAASSVLGDDVHRVGRAVVSRRRPHRLGCRRLPALLFFPFIFFSPIIDMVPARRRRRRR